MSDAFHKVTGDSLKFVTGSSGMLARQVENGAPFDVFLSANKAYVVNLAANGHVRAESVVVYAAGRLGLWAPAGGVSELGDLVRLKRIAIANPQHAPYGAAAKQALVAAGLWEVLKDRVVMGENARQALQYAESGNAEAIITAWSLVAAKGATLVPEELHEPIEQAGGILASSKQVPVARRFLEFLKSKEGARMLERHGLRPIHIGSKMGSKK